jgi:hypothetical protein
MVEIWLDASDQNSLFYKSSRCLAEVFYGQVFGQGGVITSGMAKYGSILQLLRQQLQIPMSFHRDNLMAVIMTAVVIESVANQSAAGFRPHIHGLGHVVQMAAPKAFQRRPNTLIFELCRCFIVGRAIVAQRETFVASHEWKTIPWTYEEKNTFAKLWDILYVSTTYEFQISRLTCINKL